MPYTTRSNEITWARGVRGRHVHTLLQSPAAVTPVSAARYPARPRPHRDGYGQKRMPTASMVARARRRSAGHVRPSTRAGGTPAFGGDGGGGALLACSGFIV